MTAMTQSISGATAMLLTDATDRTIYHFQCKFFGRFRLSWLLFRYVIVVFANRWNSVPSTSRHGYVVQQSINCPCKFFQCWNFVEAIDTPSTRGHSTCLVQTPHKFGSLGKWKSETLSHCIFPQPPAAQRFGMMLFDE